MNGKNAIRANERGQRILVLEDDPFQQQVIAAMLASVAGAQVSLASCGREALRRLEEEKEGFDVVLCDLHVHDVSGMDGVEFIRQLHGYRIGALILMSVLAEDLFASAEMLAAGYSAPLMGRLRKPFDAASLHAMLLRCRMSAPRERPSAQPALAGAERDLRAALRQEQFLPFFQPKMSLADGTLRGVEVLARWPHPELGLIAPGRFIPLLQQAGMMMEFTDMLYRRALAVQHEWMRCGLTTRIALNAPPDLLQDVAVPNRWRALAQEYRIDPGMVTVEVTETAVARDFYGLLETVTRLRMHGFGVSLDDFGTSHSSLQQMSELPITEVKIDRSFVARAPVSQRALLIFDAIINLATKLGLDTVAEGIESAESEEFVHCAGCQLGQGYYFGRPMPEEDVLAWARGLQEEQLV